MSDDSRRLAVGTSANRVLSASLVIAIGGASPREKIVIRSSPVAYRILQGWLVFAFVRTERMAEAGSSRQAGIGMIELFSPLRTDFLPTFLEAIHKVSG